jgi:hypothetical protein
LVVGQTATLQLTDSAGNPVDLSGAEIIWRWAAGDENPLDVHGGYWGTGDVSRAWTAHSNHDNDSFWFWCVVNGERTNPVLIRVGDARNQPLYVAQLRVNNEVYVNIGVNREAELRLRVFKNGVLPIVNLAGFDVRWFWAEDVVGGDWDFFIPTNAANGIHAFRPDRGTHEGRTWRFWVEGNGFERSTPVRISVGTATPIPTVPVITSANNFTVIHGAAGTFALTATGTTPITYSLSGTVPPGVSIDGNQLRIANTVAVGTHNFTITANNAAGNSVPQNFILTVTGAAELAEAIEYLRFVIPTIEGIAPLFLADPYAAIYWNVSFVPEYLNPARALLTRINNNDLTVTLDDVRGVIDRMEERLDWMLEQLL